MFADGLCGVGGVVVVELVSPEERAEVGLAYEFVVDEVAGCAFAEDFAFVDDVGAIADSECLLDIVVCDEDGDGAVGESADLGLEVFDGEWVDAGEGLIEEDEPGVGDECAGDFESSSFAAGAGACVVSCFVRESELFEEFVAAFFAGSAGERERFEDGEEILLDGESLEDAGLLGEVAHSQTCSSVHGESGDIASVEDDFASVGVDHAHDHAEGCGFSGAVASEEADDLGLVDIEGDTLHDGAVGEGLDQVGGFEEGHGGECSPCVGSERVLPYHCAGGVMKRTHMGYRKYSRRLAAMAPMMHPMRRSTKRNATPMAK